MNNRFNLEQLYIQAKEAYYLGESIMSDDEYDQIEKQLLLMGSIVPMSVGANDRKAKYTHPSPMLSLSKYQASIAGTPPTESATQWMKKFSTETVNFEISPKYDGSAANAIYQDGKLLRILTRGNGNKGRDITAAVKHNLPEQIDFVGIVEIRGEVVIKLSTFTKKYSEFKNPRNYVAGVLNRDDNSISVIQDLDFIPLEVKHHLNDDINHISLEGINAKHQPFEFKGTQYEFASIYEKMLQYRENSPYQLDGFVIKAPKNMRAEWGENSHDPNWAVAIKFPPKEAITTIIGISWQYGKTGEVTPVAVMEPVDLDGTTVSRAALFNYGYLLSKGAFPGATVAIAKSGDIIPQITRVVVQGSKDNLSVPKNCKCGSELHTRGIHLMCENPDCENVAYNMFVQGVQQLGIDGVGGAMLKQLWKAGYRSAVEILNPNKFSKEKLFANSDLKPGKLVDNMFKEIEKIKNLKPADVVMMLGFPGIGYSSAKQIGNMLSGIKYSFAGLEKNVVAGFEEGEIKRKKYEAAIKELSEFINIVMPEKIADDAIPCEFTGSPKSFGFKTKEDFLTAAKNKGYYYAGIKEAKVLFTDDLKSTSSKMNAARKKGIKIMLYSEIN